MNAIDKQQVISSIENVFKANNILFTSCAVKRICSKWEQGKGPLIDVLSKHPHWDWEKLAIVVTIKDSRKSEQKECLILLKPFADFSKQVYDELLNGLYFHFSSIVDGDLQSSLLDNGIDAKKGQKLSRTVGNYFKKLGLDKTMPDYEKYFAKLADSMNPLSIERLSLLSVHPVDFLTMSNGNSWTSCHDLEGSYASGTVSLMLDNVTSIFFTAKNIDETSIKTTRQCFYYEEGVLVQSRLYPSHYDRKSIENYRNIVQQIFSQCLDHPNLWTVNKNQKHVSDIVCNDHKSTAYNDCSAIHDYNCTASFLTGYKTENRSIEIGTHPICVSCGDRHEEESCLSCCRPFKCANCGITSNDSDLFKNIDGEDYCCNCFSCCDECGSFFVGSPWTVKDSCGNDAASVCESCFYKTIKTCHKCGDSFLKDDMLHISTRYDNNYYCDECACSLETCFICGDSIEDEDKKYLFEGSYHCKYCYNNLPECDCCGNRMNDEKSRFIEERGPYCETCYPSFVNEESNTTEEQLV